jgi:alpha-galactosidase
MFCTRVRTAALIAAAVLLVGMARVSADTVWLESLGTQKVQQGYGRPRASRSVDGNPISVGGKVYEHGLGTHAQSSLFVELGGAGERFTADVGVDDEEKNANVASVQFVVIGDKKKLWDSGVLHARGMKKADVDIRGVKTLVLLVNSGGDGIDCDHADWADARFEMAQGAPKAIDPPQYPGVVLTPAASVKPRINGAKVLGVHPGSPVLFRIAATGERPMTFAAQSLPEGLQLDAGTGLITGKLEKAGEYEVKLKASNGQGAAERTLRIVAGKDLALTPPMGWNSWNCWAGAVDQDKVLRAGKAMVASGLADHGWTYINIDDTWEGKQGGPLNATQANDKFPDMKGLCDSLHAMGLKAGLYSSPGPKTCANFTGSYQHEAEDAQQWAQWGFDYVKYDWCSYGGVVKGDGRLETLQKPYRLMGDILKKQNRDIVFSLCQYGMGDVSKWGYEVGGQCWRTTGDIVDTWGSVDSIAQAQARTQQYIRPGGWNDPDMLVVGYVGWGPNLHPSRLTPDEQYSHISLWCLLSSPLLIGCDMERLDAFTLNLLTNDEVLEVNQDPAGKPARRQTVGEDLEVWTKPLEDGSVAVGLFNRGYMDALVTATWKDLGLQGTQQVRDLWRQKDLGSFDEKYTAAVNPHGVVLLRVRPAGAER